MDFKNQQQEERNRYDNKDIKSIIRKTKIQQFQTIRLAMVYLQNPIWRWYVNEEQKLLLILDFKEIKFYQLFLLQNSLRLLNKFKIECQIVWSYLQKKNQIITTGIDKTIKIWEKNKELNWQLSQKLNKYQEVIKFLIVSHKEDFIVIYCKNGVLFFQSINQRQRNLQSIHFKNEILLDLNLSQNDNTLICAGAKSNIYILNLDQQSNQWNIVEKLQFSVGEINDTQLGFVNDEIFIVLQKMEKMSIKFYKINKSSQKVIKVDEENIPNIDEKFDIVIFNQPNFFFSSFDFIGVSFEENINFIKKVQNDNIGKSLSFVFKFQSNQTLIYQQIRAILVNKNRYNQFYLLKIKEKQWI